MGNVSETPNPYSLSKKYGSTPPICTAVRPPIGIAVLSWLLSFEERETLQYASHLYCSTPPICTAVRPPFVRQYFWKTTGGGGHRNVSDKIPLAKIPSAQRMSHTEKPPLVSISPCLPMCPAMLCDSVRTPVEVRDINWERKNM